LLAWGTVASFLFFFREAPCHRRCNATGGCVCTLRGSSARRFCVGFRFVLGFLHMISLLAKSIIGFLYEILMIAWGMHGISRLSRSNGRPKAPLEAPSRHEGARRGTTHGQLNKRHPTTERGNGLSGSDTARHHRCLTTPKSINLRKGDHGRGSRLAPGRSFTGKNRTRGPKKSKPTGHDTGDPFSFLQHPSSMPTPTHMR